MYAKNSGGLETLKTSKAVSPSAGRRREVETMHSVGAGGKKGVQPAAPVQSAGEGEPGGSEGGRSWSYWSHPFSHWHLEVQKLLL